MRQKDAKSCLPEKLRVELREAWDELGRNKEKYPMFWEFIHKERNNIVKEYEFSAYEAILKPDGSSRQSRGLLRFLEEGEKETLLIRGGHFAGRPALEILSEAVEWVEDYIFSAVRKAGYDPDEIRYAGSLLPIEKLGSSKPSLLGPDIEDLESQKDTEH